MDEILIDDKKYVSSKRAAKMTGYAKDYVGQLCREGRVPARLVGRSWYVLESAIQDHRFGAKETKPEKLSRTKAPGPSSANTWESPRYEASKEEPLPVINRLQDTDASSVTTPIELPEAGQDDQTRYLQDSWREWFDRIADSRQEESPAPFAAEPREIEEKEEIEPAVEEREVEQGEAKKVPIHAVYDLPPKDLLPAHTHIEQDYERHPTEAVAPSAPETAIISKNTFWPMAFQVVGLLLAALSAVVGVIGTGYYDGFIASNEQASIISGIIIYNK